MDIKKILSMCDHTLLKQTAKKEDIIKLCDEGIMYKTASVCIPPSYVSFAKNYVADKLKICTVIGFPNGYSTTETKCFEASNAVENGADEIDMVINLGWLKDKDFDKILDEINKVKDACNGKILKVIVETFLLSEDEKIKMCDIVTKSNADFIKTSTGFSVEGATFDDIETFSLYLGKNKQIKAAGGISSIDDAEHFIELGANRLGTSKIVKIVEKENLLEDDDNE